MKKGLTYLVVTLAVAGALSLFYGIYHFPDAPISRCGENCFRGKQGQTRTQADFDSFNRWLVAAPSLIGATIACGFLLNLLGRKDRT